MNLVKLTDFNLVSFICQALDQKCKNKQDMVPALKEKYTFYKKKKLHNWVKIYLCEVLTILPQRTKEKAYHMIHNYLKQHLLIHN